MKQVTETLDVLSFLSVYGELPTEGEMATAPPVISGTVRGACPHDCPDTCAMLVTVEDGRAVKVQGDPDHPFTQGGLCVKVNDYVDRVYSRDRVLQPMRRVAAKGNGKFEPVTWEYALQDEVPLTLDASRGRAT